MPMLPPDYERPKPSSYVKIKAGDEAVLRILAPPMEGWSSWADKKPIRRRTEAEFDGVKVDQKVKYFWAVPVWDVAAECIKVWEITQGTIIDKIAALDKNKHWGDAREYNLIVTREGSTRDDTNYEVMPEPKSPIPPAADDAWNALAGKFDIARLFTGGDPFGSKPDSDIPF